MVPWPVKEEWNLSTGVASKSARLVKLKPSTWQLEQLIQLLPVSGASGKTEVLARLKMRSPRRTAGVSGSLADQLRELGVDHLDPGEGCHRRR